MTKTYLQYMRDRMDGREPLVPIAMGAKPVVRKLANVMGIRTPREYYRGSILQIEWDDLPDFFALKPAFASTSIGVYLLQRISKGVYLDSREQREITVEDILARERAILERYQLSEERGQFIIEQLLRDYDGNVPPPDIRVNAFFGELGMIYIDDHLSGSIARSSYFDGNFQPFSDLSSRYAIHEQARHWQEIVERPPTPNAELIKTVAKRLSLAIPCAFVRLDLYDTPEGVYLGEITFFPGAFFYEEVKLMLPLENERLGEMWYEASQRLAAADVQPVVAELL